MSFLKSSYQRLVNMVCTEQTFDFWMQQLGRNLRLSSPSARVIKKSILKAADSSEVVQLILKPNGHFGEFKTGQHVRLNLVVDGKVLERSYSIANLPNKDNEMELLIKVQGEMSQYIANSVSQSDVIEISESFGENHESRHDVYIAGGIGISAVLPLFKAAASKDTRPVKLLCMSNERAGFLLKDYITTSLGELLKRKSLELVFIDGRSALVQPELLNQHIPANSSVISCGSTGFNQQVQTVLEGNDLNTRLTLENFAAGNEVVTDESFKEFDIHLSQQNKTIKVNNQQSILQSLLEAGVNTKFGCKQGICHQCSCKLVKGSVGQPSQNDAFNPTAKNQESNFIQTCINRPQTNLELEL